MTEMSDYETRFLEWTERLRIVEEKLELKLREDAYARQLVGIAQGMLMAEKKLSADEAMIALAQMSLKEKKEIYAIVIEMIESGKTP